MLHLQFMSFALSLIDKSRDGSLSVNEVLECLGDFAPEYFADTQQAIEEAQADGHISVMEVFNIVTSLVA